MEGNNIQSKGFENDWQTKTLENLENDHWGDPVYPSTLVIKCHKLRKKPINTFTIKDLRVMIGQNIGLKYLIPVALQKLEENILAMGGFYEGDLLRAVLASDKFYWENEQSNWKMMCRIFKENREKLKSFDTVESIKKEWFNAFQKFKEI